MSKKTTATKQRSPKPSTDGKKRPQRSRPQPKPEGVQKMATATAPASDRLTISCLGQIGETAVEILGEALAELAGAMSGEAVSRS